MNKFLLCSVFRPKLNQALFGDPIGHARRRDGGQQVCKVDRDHMWFWLKHGELAASIEETRKVIPGVMNMETWLRKIRGN